VVFELVPSMNQDLLSVDEIIKDILGYRTFVEVLGLQFGCKDTIQPAVFGVPRSCLDVA